MMLASHSTAPCSVRLEPLPAFVSGSSWRHTQGEWGGMQEHRETGEGCTTRKRLWREAGARLVLAQCERESCGGGVSKATSRARSTDQAAAAAGAGSDPSATGSGMPQGARGAVSGGASYLEHTDGCHHCLVARARGLHREASHAKGTSPERLKATPLGMPSISSHRPMHAPACLRGEGTAQAFVTASPGSAGRFFRMLGRSMREGCT